MSNEAAERLLYALADEGEPDQWDKRVGLIDEALAAERRATVERIRARLFDDGWLTQISALDRILAEEAAR